MNNKYEILSRTKVMTVSELIEQLAGQPPMMLVFAFDEDGKEYKFINDLSIQEDNNVPLIAIGFSTHPRLSNPDNKTHEENVDEKREYAMDLVHKSQKAMEFPEKVD